jgi:hypothetical protein
MFSIVVFLSFVISGVSAYHGVDVSQATSTSSFECMVENGKTFAIVRVYQSSGHTDSNGE